MIYIAVAEVNYEGDCCIKAFSRKVDAEALVDVFRKHLANKPCALDYSSARWDEYYTKYNAWEKNAPPMYSESADSFDVIEVEY